MTPLRSIAAAAAFLTFGSAAHAQYYVPVYPPPPGYRCNTRFHTPYRVPRIVCPLIRPKPVGYICHCPAPPPPPGYAYGPPLVGRVIR